MEPVLIQVLEAQMRIHSKVNKLTITLSAISNCSGNSRALGFFSWIAMALFTSVTVHTLNFTVASGSSYTSKLFRVLFGTELLKGHKAHLRGREGERERRCVRSIEAYYNAFFFFGLEAVRTLRCFHGLCCVLSFWILTSEKKKNKTRQICKPIFCLFCILSMLLRFCVFFILLTFDLLFIGKKISSFFLIQLAVLH